jgi:hypothetical protein
MRTARVLAKNGPGLYQRQNSAAKMDHHNNRITPRVFIINSSDVPPSHNIVMKAFYDSVKPYFVVLRAMGVCPLRVDNKGNDVYTDLATRSTVMEMKCLFRVMFEEKWFHIYRQLALR